MSYASRRRAGCRPGARAMLLGLDLRGGLHLLYQVDLDGAVAQFLETYEQDIRRALRTREYSVHRHPTLTVDVRISRMACACCCRRTPIARKMRAAITKVQPDIACRDATRRRSAAVDCVLTVTQVRERQDFAIQQNTPRCAIASTSSVWPRPRATPRPGPHPRRVARHAGLGRREGHARQGRDARISTGRPASDSAQRPRTARREDPHCARTAPR